MVGPDNYEAMDGTQVEYAIIDNGKHGKRVIRFRLPLQASSQKISSTSSL